MCNINTLKKKSFTHACRLLLQVKCLTCVKPAWLTQGSKSQGDTISNWIVRGCWPIRSGHRLSEVLQATCDIFYKLQLWLNPKTSKLKLPFFGAFFVTNVDIFWPLFFFFLSIERRFSSPVSFFISILPFCQRLSPLLLFLQLNHSKTEHHFHSVLVFMKTQVSRSLQQTYIWYKLYSAVTGLARCPSTSFPWRFVPPLSTSADWFAL